MRKIKLPANAKAKRNARALDRAKAKKTDKDTLALIETFLDNEGLNAGDEITIEDIDADTLTDVKRICASDESRNNRTLRITISGNDMTIRYFGGS